MNISIYIQYPYLVLLYCFLSFHRQFSVPSSISAAGVFGGSNREGVHNRRH